MTKIFQLERTSLLLLLDCEAGLFEGLVAEDELQGFRVLGGLDLALALLTAEGYLGAADRNGGVGVNGLAGQRALGLLGLLVKTS